RNAGTWSQQAYVKAHNTGTGDYFGGSVAIAGEAILIGAYIENGSGLGVNPASNESATAAGAAYVFLRNGTVWSQNVYLKATNTGSFDYFGVSVAMSSTELIVGAYGEDGSGTGVNPVS